MKLFLNLIRAMSYPYVTVGNKLNTYNTNTISIYQFFLYHHDNIEVKQLALTFCLDIDLVTVLVQMDE